MSHLRQHNFLKQCLNNDIAAIALCECLFSISQVWDDMIDKDILVSGDTLNKTFWLLLFDLPSNPFYLEHHEFLMPIVQLAVIDWLSANELERGSDHDKELAYVLRNSLTAVVIACARIIGGYEWMLKYTPIIRRFFQDESLINYKKELSHGLRRRRIRT